MHKRFYKLFYYTPHSTLRQILRPTSSTPNNTSGNFFQINLEFCRKISLQSFILCNHTKETTITQLTSYPKGISMNSKTLQSNISINIQSFITTYGESALQEAMRQYIDNQQIYIHKTKSQITKIKISDIYYLQSQQHNITIHTSHGTYKKYGTLIQELNTLYPYGFIKCTQSCIVSLSKIRTIQNNDITLIDDTVLHVSRSYAPKVLGAFNGRNYACNSSNSNISVKK